MRYKLELDLHLYFVPPMQEHGGAIVLMRKVDLPFVPTAEISIHSSTFEEVGSEPLGFSLKNLIWDIDRQVFLAHTVVVSHDVPWPLIIGEIQNWVDRGWRLGSYKDHYEQSSRAPERSAPTQNVRRRSRNWPDEEVMETWPALPPKARPKHFNRTFGVITRMLAQTHHAESLAYAMHRTQMYFTEEQLKAEKTTATERFSKALDEFYEQPFKKQCRRIDRIIAKYPSLRDVLKIS